MANSELKCEVPECTKEYRHENATIAWNLLDLHMRTAHPTIQGAASTGGGPATTPKLEDPEADDLGEGD